MRTSGTSAFTWNAVKNRMCYTTNRLFSFAFYLQFFIYFTHYLVSSQCFISSVFPSLCFIKQLHLKHCILCWTGVKLSFYVALWEHKRCNIVVNWVVTEINFRWTSTFRNCLHCILYCFHFVVCRLLVLRAEQLPSNPQC